MPSSKARRIPIPPNQSRLSPWADTQSKVVRVRRSNHRTVSVAARHHCVQFNELSASGRDYKYDLSAD